MTTTSNRSSGCFRGYTNEQKTLRAKLAQLLKWTRDLKTNIMKQSCKVLQIMNNNKSNINRQLIDQIHDDLDDYKRKLDRELGRIHDICDALANNPITEGNEENLRDEILEALRRSPTYSSLEQHIDGDEKRTRIRVKPRERIHPGQNRPAPTSYLSSDTIKRKASQPVALKLLDTTGASNTKRRAQVDAFKRSRSFTNVEHTETQLGMDYIEEDESDLSWKPFGPKRSISQLSLSSTNNEQSNDKQSSTNVLKTSQSLPAISTQKSACNDNDSSDEEFDVAWQRRAIQKARKEAAAAPPPPPPPPTETPAKRTVRFSPSTNEQVELIEIDLDEALQDDLQQIRDQNNNNRQQTEVVSIDDDDDDDDDEPIITTADTQSQITTVNNQNDGSQIINDSDDEIIALSDDEIPAKSSISRRKNTWVESEIQITSANSQSQSLHNPYRIGITDPSIRSVFLPPPNSQTMLPSTGGNRRAPSSNRRTASTKRTTSKKK
ncbi:unnamed protein product [Adineta steineri]|uniref:Uncharacterized protein n=1 Tax=Adineta steineri TaxID=433720 RepID=A0A813XJ08_9BILA|nr:unnamed protein product [Adineta steineri]CAF1620972.1 unnamed protein product [Adineta steineri]